MPFHSLNSSRVKVRRNLSEFVMTIGFRFDIARGTDTLPPEVGRGRTHTREAGGGIRGICCSRTISGLSEKFSVRKFYRNSLFTDRYS